MDFASLLPLELDLEREFHDDRSFGTYQVFFPLVQDRRSHSDKRYGPSARFSCHIPCRILELWLGQCVVHRVASRAGHVLLPTRQFGAAAQVHPTPTCTPIRVCQERDIICRTRFNITVLYYDTGPLTSAEPFGSQCDTPTFVASTFWL